jgi:hypothetical protein
VKVEPQEGKPSRKIYSITDAGMKELTDWLITKPEMAPERNPLLIKVFFGRLANGEALKNIIEDCRAYHTKILEQYETETASVIQQYAEACSSQADAAYWKLTLDFGQRYSKMVVEWCDHAVKTISQNSEPLAEKEQALLKAQGGAQHGKSRGVRKGKKTG